ncbi:hypothetical protein HOLleu_44893 [Holothuria leucospilota]|uniref:Uncharacterized protein n=1 Tax=Holothuria leucospilota TaxID=206669 RepID=A0A9Q0YC02_HOLLE|nr:hypothetical protein HOLleu_44893 [Holothuria leucospilota]
MWGTYQKHVPPPDKGCTALRWGTQLCHAPPADIFRNVCWDMTWICVPPTNI